MSDYEFINCVVNMGVASQVVKSAKKHGVKSGTIVQGRGGIYSHLSEIWGPNEEKKEIVSMVVEKGLTVETIRGICEDMKLNRPDHGIAFSIPVTELTDCKISTENSGEASAVKDCMYQIIYVVVDKGMAEEVIDAAYMAGARGSTTIGAKGGGANTAKKLFSPETQTEKEMVFLITKSELKNGIVKSIRERLNPDDKGNCMMYVMDISELYGLHE